MYLQISKAVFLTTLIASSLFSAEDKFAVRDQRYRIHPGDVVAISYRYSPEYNATVSVQPDGFVTLPIIGDVKIEDLTLDEARQQLLTRAKERLNDPEINLDLKEFEKPYYIVGGEVGAPGKFEIRGHMTALRAIEIAGGVRSSGKASQVLLIRPIDNGMAQTKLIDIKNIIDKRQPQEDVELRAGDMLIIPKTRIAKAEPFIRMANPGTYGLYINPTTF